MTVFDIKVSEIGEKRYPDTKIPPQNLHIPEKLTTFAHHFVHSVSQSEIGVDFEK